MVVNCISNSVKSMKIKNSYSSNGFYFILILALFIGFYPLNFISSSNGDSLLGRKSDTLLNYPSYCMVFYAHIFLGGLSLILGAIQFFPGLRIWRPILHKVFGKLYVLSVIISGSSGLFIAFYAEGGFITSLGFSFLAIFWLFTTIIAFLFIKKVNLIQHENWMIRSYALCFAAVTLRLYITLVVGVLNMEFIRAYTFIAWLCWVPNLFVAELIILKRI